MAHIDEVAGWRIGFITIGLFFLCVFFSLVVATVASALGEYRVVSIPLVGLAGLMPWGLPLVYLVSAITRRNRSPGDGHVRFAAAVQVVDFTSDNVTLEILNPRFVAVVKQALATPATTILGPLLEPPPSSPAVSAPAEATPRPVVDKVSEDAVRRRLAALPRDAKPERALRFVAREIEIRSEGLTAIGHDDSRHELSFRDCASVYARRLPHEPPWDGAFVMDLAPASGPPIRVFASTLMNFDALPGGGAPSHIENSRKLAALVEEHNQELAMDPETRTFVSGFGPCMALAGIEQFLRHDAQFA